MCIQHVDLLIVHIVRGDNDVGAERLWQRKTIVIRQKDGVLVQRRSIGYKVRDNDHISRILHQNARVAMVRMVVVGSGRNHEVRFPRAYLANHLLTHAQGRQKLAIMIVEHLVLNPDATSCFLGFSAAPHC